MSGAGHGFRVSAIPRNVRSMIQNIKEIGCCHNEEEIYAMLKECRMDPNETAQKLLLQDTFHEVKRKKDRRKENMNNREATDSRWRSGPSRRVGRGVCGSFSSRHSADVGGEKHSFSATENGIKQPSENAVQDPLALGAKDAKIKETASFGSVTLLDNGPKYTSDIKSAKHPEVSLAEESPSDATKNLSVGSSDVITNESEWVCSKPSTMTGRSVGSSGVRRTRSSSVHAKLGSKPQGARKDQLAEVSRPPSSSGNGDSLSNRLSSNYTTCSHQVTGPPRGPTKEWKPKATYSSHVPVSRTSAETEQSSTAAAETAAQNLAVHGSLSGSEELVCKIEKELETLHVKDTHHVIIPNHIHVPEAIRNGLSFGSFDAASISCRTAEDPKEGHLVSNSNIVVPPEEQDSINHPHSCTHVPETVPSSGAKVSSSSVLGDESEKKTGIAEHQMVHTSLAHSFGAEQMPVLGSLTSSNISDGQAHHASRVPNFTVQQPIEPATASFYAQFYHCGDSDGHISPFAASTSYNGNFPFLPAQTSESLQEGSNRVSFSTTGQAPPANQAGIMLNNIPATQQPVPLYRQPNGLPMPQYSPNYMPYGHYYPPFYASPPPVHQYVGNDAFLQQAQASSIYSPPTTGATAGVKYAVPQFKRGSHSGHPTHMSTTGGYGIYGTPASGHDAGSVAAAGNSGANEDLTGSQYRENSAYNAGQQTESSTIWIAARSRDISGLQATSFYNLPPQGQHVTFPPSQGHVSFASAYHPAQTVTAATLHPLLQHSQAMPGAVDMVGPTPAGVYHQPRHATPMNWPNNF